MFVKTSPQSEAAPVVLDEYGLQSMSTSSDGYWLAYGRRSPGNTDIMLVELTGSLPGKPQPLLDSRFDEQSPRFSPAAPLLAYESNETGRPEIWLRRIQEATSQTPARVSREGGETPVWSRDGRALYFHGGTSLMAVPVAMAPESRARYRRSAIAGLSTWAGTAVFWPCTDPFPASRAWRSSSIGSTN